MLSTPNAQKLRHVEVQARNMPPPRRPQGSRMRPEARCPRNTRLLASRSANATHSFALGRLRNRIAARRRCVFGEKVAEASYHWDSEDIRGTYANGSQRVERFRVRVRRRKTSGNPDVPPSATAHRPKPHPSPVRCLSYYTS